MKEKIKYIIAIIILVIAIVVTNWGALEVIKWYANVTQSNELKEAKRFILDLQDTIRMLEEDIDYLIEGANENGQ